MLTQCQGSIRCINKMHAKIIVGGYGENVFVGSKLFTMYSELGRLYMKDAQKVFDNLSERDVFLWNSKIQTYANSGLSTEALDVYKEMCEQGVVMDKYTFTFVLKASGIVKDENTGCIIHGHVVKCGFYSNVFVGNALVAFYAKCKMIEACRRVFEEIPQKDLVSWNAIISGYTTNGCFIEALELFHALLHDESIGAPEHASLVAILPACTQAADVRLGFWIHCYTIKTGLANDAMLGSGLIAMYGNCGHLDYACHVFDQIPERNIMVWTAMMRSCGMHGNAEKTLNLFSNFLKDGLRPDGVMFLCLLSTCSHAGLVAKGREIFKQMDDYGIEKGQEHYACMVDLFGRAGLVMEAAELIETMPMVVGKDVYGALLGACGMHNNIGLAEVAAEKLFGLDPESGGRYVTLAKIYGSAGRLKEAAAVRKTMVKSGIKKAFGCSMVEVEGVVHRFGAEDETHVRRKEIFETLAKVDKMMAEEI
ncbi:pentatricopeptide repeat-containing protein At1g08070, chloroplastic-like [Cynara cardunculus var. scolymus]|uniref:pentatricopeptide repeat-containing protein At1g08070, chloroplastic-like n=1 Tax=Cynara cardunculus var. scolymus TaxID=59895 RepID=UPI000D62BCE2|nr:pentatricopeptide repeat-containing protein At1g08070, chloroplastic-like [Cynara cardunculus var. scolymus]